MIIGIAFAVFVAIFIGSRLTGILQYYHVPTVGSEPAIMAGDHVVATNLKKPSNGNIICFKTEQQGRPAIFLQRLCGMAGDTISMVEGVFFLNGENFDQALNLKHIYYVDHETVNKLLRKKKIRVDSAGPMATDTIMVFLDNKLIAEEKIQCRRNITPRGALPDQSTFVFTTDSGSIDNFGPYVVPDGSYFLLGDNRENSLDSRFTGYVPAKEWIGTVIGK